MPELNDTYIGDGGSELRWASPYCHHGLTPCKTSGVFYVFLWTFHGKSMVDHGHYKIHELTVMSVTREEFP